MLCSASQASHASLNADAPLDVSLICSRAQPAHQALTSCNDTNIASAGTIMACVRTSRQEQVFSTCILMCAGSKGDRRPHATCGRRFDNQSSPWSLHGGDEPQQGSQPESATLSSAIRLDSSSAEQQGPVSRNISVKWRGCARSTPAK